MLFWLVMTPFFLQGVAFCLDEFVFHHRRGLPRWERLGHPMDTATIIAPLVYAAATKFDPTRIMIFAAMALASCLFVTKDEFVHAERCEPKEQWLHAVLFVLHPLLFVAVGVLWYLESIGIVATPGGIGLTAVLQGQIIFLVCILSYQIIYWSVIWPRLKPQSTMQSTKSSATAGIPQRTTR